MAAYTRFRFGTFEIDRSSNELRKNGLKIRIEHQPFQILSMLVSRQSDVVTREELKEALWAHDTHVDFDHSLNRAVNKVRVAIGDSASNPLFIETLPRRGYRFMAPVTTIDDRGESDLPEQLELDTVSTRGLPDRRGPFRAAAYYLLPAALLIAATVAIVWYQGSVKSDSPEWKAVPLTTLVGIERNPALSPAGNQVAFSWNGPDQSNFDIYRTEIGPGDPIRLTNHAAPEYGPAWSPDGRTIAFMRRVSSDRAEVWAVPVQGGPEHHVTATAYDEVLENMRFRQLSWSPDGRWLALSDRAAGENTFGLFLVSLDTGARRRLTEPPKGTPGDHSPAFAPDGRSVAFLRLQGHSASEVYVLSLSAEAHPAENAQPLTDHHRSTAFPAWSHDGRHVLYLLGEHPEIALSLMKVAVSGVRKPQRIGLADDRMTEFAFGSHLIYSRKANDYNIWRAAIPDDKHRPVEPHLFLASTRTEFQPQYSPDGRRIAFISFRSGTREIWIADADGAHASQLTRFNGPLVGLMNWASDGQRLVFHARPDGQADLFTIAMTGGEPKRLTSHLADDTQPSYSADGRTVYFSSLRSGRNEVWKMPAEGGEATQVTHAGGWRPFESRDGKTVYYVPSPAQGIWRRPIQGGQAQPVAGPINEGMAYCVRPEGIYFIAPPERDGMAPLTFYEFASGKKFTITTVRRPSVYGLTVSPDRRFILFAQLDQSGSDLMLVPDFR